jgi:glutathione S-transferase
MKLYWSPGACSLSPHIALRESGIEFKLEKVDLKAKRTENDADYWQINPKGSVPTLVMENGEALTEGPAIVQYIADQVPAANLAPKAGTLERYRLMEMLNYITSELHKGFSPLFNRAMPEEAQKIFREQLEKKFAFINNVLEGRAARDEWLLGGFSVADGYLFTVCRWARAFRFEFGPNLNDHFKRMMQRPAVRAALEAEGLPLE